MVPPVGHPDLTAVNAAHSCVLDRSYAGRSEIPSISDRYTTRSTSLDRLIHVRQMALRIRPGCGAT
jgi:hypothetical protein